MKWLPRGKKELPVRRVEDEAGAVVWAGSHWEVTAEALADAIAEG